MHIPLLVLLAVLLQRAHSQSSPPTSATPAPITLNITSAVTLSSGSLTSVFTTVFPTTIILNASASATPSATSSSNTTQHSSTSTPLTTLYTTIDPGFGVLGVLLILSGLPSAFLGHKNRWTSFFLIGCYTLALVCFVLILKFGVLDSINPPSKKLRGIFVFACSVVGVAGGGIAIFFWRQTKFFIGAWGGFVLALWIQSFRNGGVIREIGFRWIFYIATSVLGFILCAVSSIHYHLLLLSTAAVGATATVLGIDCFTTANLKEFYVWNLGFNDLFPKYTGKGIQFPISQTMAIELGLIAALTVMGAAVQLNVLKQLQIKLREIRSEQKKRNERLEAEASARFAASTVKEMAEWEREHGRADSQFSRLPLLKGSDANSPTEASTFVGDHRRHPSGMSEFKAATPGQEDERRKSVALPALDVGGNLEAGITKEFMGDEGPLSKNVELKKEELLSEIAEIRRSIDQLRSGSPGSSSGAPHSRVPSFSSRRTLSVGFADALDAPPVRPPRATNPHHRNHSVELSRYVGASAGTGIARPSSVPPQDDVDWNEYVRERKLFQPPSGISHPIPTTPLSPIAPRPKRIPVSAAVSEALHHRQQQEVTFEAGEWGVRVPQHGQSASHDTSEDVPLSLLGRTLSVTHGPPAGSAPASVSPKKSVVLILPPRKQGSAPAQTILQESPTRVRTFEELEERHREKLHGLQAPLSQAESSQAKLAEARSRWESSMKYERQSMAKREAEKAAAAKQRKEDKEERKKALADGQRRTLSADLGKLPGASAASSKRQSMLKVEDWRRFQQEMDSDVPFPASQSLREPGRRNSTFHGRT